MRGLRWFTDLPPSLWRCLLLTALIYGTVGGLIAIASVWLTP